MKTPNIFVRLVPPSLSLVLHCYHASPEDFAAATSDEAALAMLLVPPTLSMVLALLPCLAGGLCCCADALATNLAGLFQQKNNRECWEKVKN
jgi:hypothetical protein